MLRFSADALSQQTTMGYDNAGNLISRTDPANSCGALVQCVTSDGYDNADQVTSASYSDGVTPNVAYTYKPNGTRATIDGRHWHDL